MSGVVRVTPLAWMDDVTQRATARLRSVSRAVIRVRAELLLTLAMLGGWAGVTWGLALLTTWKVWPLSAGLLLLSCGGWRMVWTVASYGLYGLTRGPDGRDG